MPNFARPGLVALSIMNATPAQKKRQRRRDWVGWAIFLAILAGLGLLAYQMWN